MKRDRGENALLQKILEHAKNDLGLSDIGIISLEENKPIDNELFDILRDSVIRANPWAKSIIIAVLGYVPYRQDFPKGKGVYSAHYRQYPLGRKAIQCLAEFIQKTGHRAVADSHIPVKAAAYCSGLGWFGKNSLIYADNYGSWVTLHSLVSDISLSSSVSMPRDISNCGSCRLCIDACPTKAIVEGGRLLPGHCIREYMLTQKAVPVRMRGDLSINLLGCEICQVVCPMNAKGLAQATLPTAEELEVFDIKSILAARGPGLKERLKMIASFIGNNYAGDVQIISAAVIAAGNLRDSQYTPFLVGLLSYPHTSVRQHVAWALGAIGGADAKEALKCAFSKEQKECVKKEIVDSLFL